ncbi:transcription elongation factor GreA [Paenibacillus sediminis]|uniref:Transcription elongation factor GreA n=1 Tax=Paenibacillus sediminis TaxID=664909 RepID=A0ABS4H171_9BACL|nr:transcription elongation factor GreA [Paenibacillus sediminis]MBP1936274.1 transcription elongation factor GreA [Paenibacillus sediminis]
MENNEIVVTREGLAKLEEELEYLKSVKRREVAERIKTAIGYGDLSENSEYDEAKNEQAFVEGRILTLEKMLKNIHVADENSDKSTVYVGATVRLKDLEFDEELEYMIVGQSESDPSNNKISYVSPLGQALVGKKSGSIVEVAAPDGVIQYKILEIK